MEGTLSKFVADIKLVGTGWEAGRQSCYWDQPQQAEYIQNFTRQDSKQPG